MTLFSTLRLHVAASATAALSTILMTGCAGRDSLYTMPTPPSPAAAGLHLHGRAHGGQQPIAGSSIQIYEIGTSGTGSASQAILGTPVLTDANGMFVLPTYSCDYGSLVYLTATGGNPGLAAGTNNPAVALMSAIGPCDFYNTNGSWSLDPGLFLQVNEVSTAAAIYALAPFMADITHIGSGGNNYGITNAFTTAQQLADISLGSSPGPALPSAVTFDPNTGFPAVINTTANIIANCINSSGNDNACNSLFSATAINGSTPTNVAAAMLSMVKNPAHNVATLFGQIPAFAPFSPALSTAPKDWTLALNYTGLGITTPKAIAFDSYSDLWIVSQGDAFVTELYSAVGFTAGLSTQYEAGLIGPQSIAIDTSGNVWVANTAGSTIVKLDGSGNVLSGIGFTGGGINAPISIAMDNAGNAWVANFNGNSLTRLGFDGTPSSFSPLTQNNSNSLPVSLPVAVSVDGQNNVYVSNSGLGTNGLQSMVLEFDQYGNGIGCQTTNSLLAGPMGMAVDNNNNVWIAGSSIAAVQSYATQCSPSAFGTAPITGGGLNQPSAVAIDSNNTVWIANTTASGSFSAIAAGTIQAQAGSAIAVSPTSGFGTLNMPSAIAVDGSGNLWTANAGDNTVTEFIGLAAPTVTPIVSAIP